MPATEQTWRDTKLLHVVFGLTALAMFVATVWMLAKDHARPWKAYQRKFQAVETWTAEARVQEQATSEYEKQGKQLTDKLLEVQAGVPAEGLYRAFVGAAERLANDNGYDLASVQAAWQSLGEPTSDVAKKIDRREKLIGALRAITKKAKFKEDNLQTDLKFARANLDVVRSVYSIAVDEGKSTAELEALQQDTARVDREVLEKNKLFQAAKMHRLELEGTVAKITAEEDAAKKALADHQGKMSRLVEARDKRSWNFGKALLEMPIIDAFGRPLKIDQIWLPQLTFNNNFRDVARFDRCTTCHQGIEKTAPGSAVAPGYEPVTRFTLKLTAPKDLPKPTEKGVRPTARDYYGFELAAEGMLRADDVTVEVVWPNTIAALAGLQGSDVIEAVDGAKLLDRGMAVRYLLQNVKAGQTFELSIRRGVPQPFSSHPRLDLFVGSLSPHKLGEIGCTICHEGQGSATEFKWASHTPNTPQQASDWKRDHGWFNNHHWIYPMNPDRFVESSCLKCHHNVVELEPSERFPDPPAAKLVEGYHLIREYGCFGCHEINGYDGPTKRRGPDMRSEPTYFAAAQSVLNDPGLTDRMKSLASEVVDHPERTDVRKLLAELIRTVPATDPQVKLASRTIAAAEILNADDETPGQFRKVGPSLRYIKSKVDLEFLYSWIANPTNFRPSTKMPRFFGLHDHLAPEPKTLPDGRVALDASGHPVMEPAPGLQASLDLEPVEIRAVSEYLLSVSEPFEYTAQPKGVSEAPSVERGKAAFEVRGCLACHQHPDFPVAKDTQGPDLAKLGAKLTGDRGRKWLYSWVREPNRYHARTVMPNLYLDVIKSADGKTSDPAADITAYLLSSQGWKAELLPAINGKALDKLTMSYLSGSFTLDESQRYVAAGIPMARAGSMKGDDLMLVGDNMSADEMQQKKLLYVGRRTITRLGCAGCHDIPNYEDAKTIGTGLADWGRKEPSKLAFEQIVAYLGRRQAEAGHGHGDEEIAPHTAGGHDAHGGHAHLTSRDVDPDAGFYLDSLHHHSREGFIWQKLREPRSYDYQKTEQKDYIERLRMPKFNFTKQQREAVITFVLGLVAEPPAAKYVYKPNPRQQAIQHGQALLTKYNCTGCHTLAMEQWTVDYKPFKEGDDTTLQPPPPFTDYAFLKPHFTPAELKKSAEKDRRGLGRAVLSGMPNPEVGEDDDGKPLYYFSLWKNTPIDGQVWTVGSVDFPVPAANLVSKRPPHGGDLARLLHPVVLETEKKVNPNVKASDVWGWVPPPLIGEGKKVQTSWLHGFLLDPHPIRPAAVLRMPRFNMSSDEAGAFVNYFAAVDNVDFPYEFDGRKRDGYLAAAEQKHPQRLREALGLVTDNNYCVKCHLIGDYTPPGAAAALAPQLDRISQRLRPDYLERWIANPKRLLPYTGMPVNFPEDKPADQKLFKGTSREQVDAVVDLLLNWPRFTGEQLSVSKLVKPAATPPAAAAEPAKSSE